MAFNCGLAIVQQHELPEYLIKSELWQLFNIPKDFNLIMAKKDLKGMTQKNGSLLPLKDLRKKLYPVIASDERVKCSITLDSSSDTRYYFKFDGFCRSYKEHSDCDEVDGVNKKRELKTDEEKKLRQKNQIKTLTKQRRNGRKFKLILTFNDIEDKVAWQRGNCEYFSSACFKNVTMFLFANKSDVRHSLVPPRPLRQPERQLEMERVHLMGCSNYFRTVNNKAKRNTPLSRGQVDNVTGNQNIVSEHAVWKMNYQALHRYC